jgi:tetratricopeptide (TPR) repeat protein
VFTASAQEKRIDSLKYELSRAAKLDDSLQVFRKLIRTYFNSNIDSSLKLSEQYLELVKRSKDERLRYAGYYNYAEGLRLVSKYDEALKNDFIALEIARKGNVEEGEGETLMDIALCYRLTSQFPLAITYLRDAYQIFRKIGRNSSAANALIIIGNVYNSNLVQTDSALVYYNRALSISTGEDARQVRAYVFLNRGDMYYYLGNRKKARDDYYSAWKLFEAVHFPIEAAKAKSSYAYCVIEDGDFKGGDSLYRNALNVFKKSGHKEEYRTVSLYFSELLFQIGKYKEAYLYKDSSMKYNEMLFNEGKQKSLNELMVKFETEKKEQEIKMNQLSLSLKDEELSKNKIQKVAISLGLAMVLIFTFLLFKRFRVTQEQKKIIELQKHLVEEKQKEILDSIRYAKRIQQSLLPTEKYLRKVITRPTL